MKNLKKSFLFFCLLCNSFCFFSQDNLDNIKKLYKKSGDTSYSYEDRIISINKVIAISTKINNNKYLLKGYNRKSFLFYRQEKYDSAIFTAKLLLDRSKETNNTPKKTLAYKRLADSYRQKNDLILAIQFYEKHKKNSLLKKDEISVIKDLRYIASLQKTLGFVVESEKTAIEALKLASKYNSKEKKLKDAELGLYNHLGMLYKGKEIYAKAIEYYDRALLVASNESDINSIHNNKANIYLDQKKYNKALTIYQELYQKAKQLKDRKKIAKALSNLGVAQAKLQNPEALLNLLKSLDIKKKENDVLGEYVSYKHLTEFYSDRDDAKKVLFYANKAYEIARNLNHNMKKIEALSYFLNLNDDSKIIEYYQLKESIEKTNKPIEDQYAALKYDYDERDKMMKEKQANQHFYKLLFLSIGIFILCVSLLVIFLLKVKNKKEKIQQVYITETRISQKVHDEVANDIFGMMTKLQINESQNAEILDDLERVYVKTRDISKENSIIDFTENFDEILQDLLTSYQNDTVNVMTKDLNKIDWNTISKLKKTAIYRVLQELMTNMKKHSKATITIISFEEKNNKLNINYKDNGIGCIINKNTGLQNTENRIQSVNGSIIFESQTNKGFDVKITI